MSCILRVMKTLIAVTINSDPPDGNTVSAENHVTVMLRERHINRYTQNKKICMFMYSYILCTILSLNC